MNVTERFIKYVKVHTASVEDIKCTPSSQIQFDLAKALTEEMTELGFQNIILDEHAYVYGELPATDGLAEKPAIVFIAHLDTIPDFSGENVRPQVISNYDGNDVVLGTSGRVLSPKEFPRLADLAGQTLITTDGTTVLGADDKAGIAEIMTAFETLLRDDIPHRRVIACFTPDEEIGHGAAFLDIERTGALFGYTVDGGTPCEINYETFNAAEARWSVKGFNIHPGSAKNKMLNAGLIAMEINSMLPQNEIPSKTEGYEGFFHLTEMKGDVSSAELRYIIRDHDAAKFESRCSLMQSIEGEINKKYGEDTAKLSIIPQYRNMAELLKDHFEVVDMAKDAIRKEGMNPETPPIRGGTDGSQLTFRGLLCPNLGTGGYAAHGPYEHVTSEAMETVVRVILNIITHE